MRANLYDERHLSLHDPFPITNPGQFFGDLKALIIRHAGVAQREGADLLVLGSEMNAITGAEYRSYWLDIIASARGIFAGKISYGYNPNLSFPPTTPQALSQVLSFWDQLDYVGLSIYHPLSLSTAPTVDELVAAWYRNPLAGSNLVENIKLFNRLTGKRVLFTEIGYTSIDGAATNPGSPALAGAADFQEQADLYTAMLSVMAREGHPSWLAGMLLFDCAIAFRPRDQFYANTTWGWSKQFVVDGKPAAAVIRQFFTGETGEAPGAPTVQPPVVVGSTVTLRWNPPAAGNVSDYVLEAGSGPGSSNLYNASVGAAMSITATVGPGTYYVRIRARGLGGSIGAPSNEVSFTVGGGGCTAAPAVPSGVSGSVLSGIATVRWNPVSGASSYIVHAGPSPGTSSLFNGNVGGSVIVSAPVGAGFRAYVRVYAVNGCGQSGASADALIQ